MVMSQELKVPLIDNKEDQTLCLAPSSSSMNGNDFQEGLKPKCPVAKETPVSLKTICLNLLTLQSTLLTLLIRYVGTREREQFCATTAPICATTAPIMSEAFKVCASLVIILFQTGGIRGLLKLLYEDIVLEPWDCVKVSIPSLVYVLQTNLVYVAVSNLDAVTFQVMSPMGILITAIFSVVLLKKVLSGFQWISLVMLFVGVATVQMQPKETKMGQMVIEHNPILGLVAVIISRFMSGFAIVYFEMILKGTRQSV